MARINTIIQGFVDINLETDENSSTRIIQTSISPTNLQKSLVIDKLEPPISIDRILEIIELNSAGIKSIHVQGSRLYGTDNLSSDWDLSIISSNVPPYQFKKFTLDNSEYDIHIYSQDRFQFFIDRHDMRELEFIFHPPKSILVENNQINFEIDKKKLINRVKLESDYLWDKAKSELGVDGYDNYSSLKRIFHSIRFLIFAEQILKDGEITDFSAANYLYEPIVRSQVYDFSYFESLYSNIRNQFKLDLDAYIDTSGFQGREVLL